MLLFIIFFWYFCSCYCSC